MQVELFLACAVGQAQEVLAGGLQIGLRLVPQRLGAVQIRSCRQALLYQGHGSLVTGLGLHQGSPGSRDPGACSGDFLGSGPVAQFLEAGSRLGNIGPASGHTGFLAGIVQLHQQSTLGHHGALGNGLVDDDLVGGGLEHDAVALQCAQRLPGTLARAARPCQQQSGEDCRLKTHI